MRKYDIIEFDPVFYRNNNNDLMNLSDADLHTHYHLHGYDEGRRASPLSTRLGLIEAIGSTKTTLEIGPFFKPTLRGDNVRYFDVYTTDELRSRARAIGGIESDVPNIDFVSREGLISSVIATFDYIFSSHSIEHQPDLIGHLRDAAKILADDGVYWFIIPDCRYSFDALLPPSKISDIITAYFGARKVHTVGSVIEHRAMTTHNDPARHWEEHRDLDMQYEIDPSRVKAALEEFSAAKGDYIDVHAWQFTPLSFASILRCLIALKMIPFNEVRVMGTPRGSNEFTAMLKRR